MATALELVVVPAREQRNDDREQHATAEGAPDQVQRCGVAQHRQRDHAANRSSR
jgi:hypothetical protein